MAKNGWLKDQFDEVRRDLDKWDKSRLNAARKEVNAIGSNGYINAASFDIDIDDDELSEYESRDEARK